ncbi:MAG: bifunctional DNA-formamidopyrimidine glycosylase/DNA-(apurinic or apyrimidinic site) lyase [bacterium]|nr:bifunctional DNA-formamidopyrimidine glycosylase/DNA-(apurinic or apyrimidinic site) lyase [bacterium]
MPELPEVETVVNDLKTSNLIGCTIKSSYVGWARTVNTHTIDQFEDNIKGLRFLGIYRRAKYIVFQMSQEKLLIIHLRMTGQFSFQSRIPDCKHTHVILELNDNRYLCFKDTRKFGRWSLVDNSHKLFSKLGPEPLDESINDEQFYLMCKSRQRQLKPLLLDQTFIAGLGNIYVDEALFDCGLHPLSSAHRLTRAKTKQLLISIRKVLRKGLRNMGTTLGTGAANFYSVSQRQGNNQEELLVFRRTGMPCYKCGGTIKRLIVGQRSTHVCTLCQKRV